jgi:hypothetical protein
MVESGRKRGCGCIAPEGRNESKGCLDIAMVLLGERWERV